MYRTKFGIAQFTEIVCSQMRFV